MKITIEVKDGNKTTNYTADFQKSEEALKKAASEVRSFVRQTFKKETITKE